MANFNPFKSSDQYTDRNTKLNELKDALLQWLSVGTHSNLPDKAKRHNPNQKRREVYDKSASSWGQLESEYNENVKYLGGNDSAYHLNLANSTGTLPRARASGTYDVDITGDAATVDGHSVQSDDTDTTDGALMTVGAGGLLSGARNVALTDITQAPSSFIEWGSGQPSVDGDVIGEPMGLGVVIRREGNNPGNGVIFVQRETGTLYALAKSQSDGTWTPLRKHYHTGNTGKTSGLVAEDSAHADDADTLQGNGPGAFVKSGSAGKLQYLELNNEEWNDTGIGGGQLQYDADSGLALVYGSSGNAPYGIAGILDVRNTIQGANISITGGKSSDSRPSIEVTQGSGSGLDADTLDGQHGSYYENPARFESNTTTNFGDNQVYSFYHGLSNIAWAEVWLEAQNANNGYSSGDEVRPVSGSNYQDGSGATHREGASLVMSNGMIIDVIVSNNLTVLRKNSPNSLVGVINNPDWGIKVRAGE